MPVQPRLSPSQVGQSLESPSLASNGLSIDVSCSGKTRSIVFRTVLLVLYMKWISVLG